MQNTRDGFGLPRNTAGFERATVFYPKRIAVDHSHALAATGDSVCGPSTKGRAVDAALAPLPQVAGAIRER
jgi:hypothetical protein